MAKKREAEEYKVKFEQLQDLLIYNAFLTSRWVWAKKVDIKSILEKKKQNKKMSDDEMLEQIKVLNRLFGGEVIEHGAEK